MELIILYAIIPALFVYMLDYGFGKPGDEQFNTKSFLFSWSLFLAKKALKKAGLLDGLLQQYNDQMTQASTALDRVRVKKSWDEFTYNQGRELFTWQNVAGMCPICTHFWVNIIFLFFLQLNIITFISLILAGHIFIRIFKKYF